MALLTVGAGIFALVLGVLWFFLPFAVFGIKDRLDQLINVSKDIRTELYKNNILLDKLLEETTGTDHRGIEKETEEFDK